MDYDYDLFVIGAGSGGVRAARMSAALGASVAIAEDRYLGGTCVNVGCVPKKLFVYGSHFKEDFEDASAYGWSGSSPEFDWSVLRDNKTKEIKRLNGIYHNLLTSPGVEIISSKARLKDAHTVQIAGDTVSADKILVATGSWPIVPEFPGSQHMITSNEAFYLDNFPERVVILGGGYIAVEFAGIFHGLGAETTLIYRGDLFLRGFDKGVRTFVFDELREKGIDVRFNTNIESIEANGHERIVRLNTGETLVADDALCATGRNPLTKDLGLREAGVATGSNGEVLVDENYRSSVKNIFAIGDVIGRVQLTPVAIAEGMCIAYNQFNDENRRVSYENIPTAVFCQPNIGTVGPTEERARELYPRLKVYESTFRAMKHTLSGRQERMLMKLLVDEDTDRVVGAHMVGPDAGEIIQGLGVAISAKATKADFDTTIGIHPTAAEEFVTMREAIR